MLNRYFFANTCTWICAVAVKKLFTQTLPIDEEELLTYVSRNVKSSNLRMSLDRKVIAAKRFNILVCYRTSINFVYQIWRRFEKATDWFRSRTLPSRRRRCCPRDYAAHIWFFFLLTRSLRHRLFESRDQKNIYSRYLRVYSFYIFNTFSTHNTNVYLLELHITYVCTRSVIVFLNSYIFIRDT